MIKLTATNFDIKKAESKANEMGEINNSLTRGHGNYTGFLGEAVIANYIGAKEKNTYDYDMVLNNITIDAKTKQTTVVPRYNYECSVYTSSLHQQCDAYAFSRMMNDNKTIYFFGIISKIYYFDNARYLKKGDIDGSNRHVVLHDCYNMKIGDVWNFYTQTKLHKQKLAKQDV